MKVDYPKPTGASTTKVRERLASMDVLDDHSGEEAVESGVLLVQSTLAPIATAAAGKPSSRALAELESRKSELLAAAQSITVQDQPSYEFAAALRQQVRKVSDAIEGYKRPSIKLLHEAHAKALDDLKLSIAPLTQAEAFIKGKQDNYQNNLRRAQEAERRRLETAMEEARQRTLREEMETAAASATPNHLDSVIERMAQPAITVPMIPVKAKAAGASGTLVKKFRMLDPAKLSPAFIMGAILSEIAEKGECVWLTTAINKEMRYRGKGAEQTVGTGSIEYYEEISTGVRR